MHWRFITPWVPHLRPEFTLGPARGRTRGAFVRDDVEISCIAVSLTSDAS